MKYGKLFGGICAGVVTIILLYTLGIKLELTRVYSFIIAALIGVEIGCWFGAFEATKKIHVTIFQGLGKFGAGVLNFGSFLLTEIYRNWEKGVAVVGILGIGLITGYIVHTTIDSTYPLYDYVSNWSMFDGQANEGMLPMFAMIITVVCSVGLYAYWIHVCEYKDHSLKIALAFMALIPILGYVSVALILLVALTMYLVVIAIVGILLMLVSYLFANKETYAIAISSVLGAIAGLWLGGFSEVSEMQLISELVIGCIAGCIVGYILVRAGQSAFVNMMVAKIKWLFDVQEQVEIAKKNGVESLSDLM